METLAVLIHASVISTGDLPPPPLPHPPEGAPRGNTEAVMGGVFHAAGSLAGAGLTGEGAVGMAGIPTRAGGAHPARLHSR